MTWPKRKATVAVILAVLALSAWGLVVLLQEPPPVAVQPEAAIEFSGGLSLVGRLKGERQWSIQAQEMQDNGSTAVFYGIERGIIYNNDEEYLTFRADKAVLEKERDGKEINDLHLTGNVTVFRHDEPVMSTQQLDWDSLARLLRAPNAVQFRYDGHELFASSMVLDAERDEVLLQDNVRVHLSDGTKLTVEGALLYYMNSGEFTTKGPVQITTAW